MEVASASPAATVRRSDRVCLTLLLEASGRDAEGHEFAEPARAMLISRHGGEIVAERALAEGEQVHRRRTLETVAHRAGMVRVIRNVGTQNGAQLYSIECVNPQ